MPEGTLFQGITDEQYNKMMVCFHASEKSYLPEEIICTYGENNQRIGILLQGEVSLIRIQEDGHQALLEYLHTGDIFGEALSIFSNKIDPIQVVCTKQTRIQYIDYSHLVKRCPKACPFHSILVSNALTLLSNKAIQLSERLEVLSQRSIREKLLRCFTLMASEKQSPSFLLPFSFSSLADYLSVDRSAMMREIGKLKKEGLLLINKRKILLVSHSRL